MPIRPTAVGKPWARTRTVRPVLVGSTLLIASLLIASGPRPAGAEDAAGIVTKMFDSYKNIKTYEATIVTNQSGKAKEGQFGVMATQNIRFKAPNLAYSEVKQVGSGVAKGKVEANGVILNCDGKTVIQYLVSKKMYRKQAAPPTLSIYAVLAFLKVLPGPKTPNIQFALGAPTTVSGHAAYTILVKPQVPKDAPADQKQKIADAIKKVSIKFTVDKSNYHMLTFKQVNGPSSVDIDVHEHVINSALAANAFGFKLPADAKEAPAAPPASGAGAPQIGAPH